MPLPKDVYLQMAGNNRKLVALVLFFPVALSAFIYAFLWLFQALYNKGSETEYYTDLCFNYFIFIFSGSKFNITHDRIGTLSFG